MPYFCNSHLLARLDVAAVANDPQPLFDVTVNPLSQTTLDRVLSPANIEAATAMAAAGKYHRRFEFGRGGGIWVINGAGWDEAKIAASDVGQNTWELWLMKAGGGWFHPGLLVFLCVVAVCVCFVCAALRLCDRRRPSALSRRTNTPTTHTHTNAHKQQQHKRTVHIHLVDFYLLQRNGPNSGALWDYERGSPKDVMYLGPGNSLWVLVR